MASKWHMNRMGLVDFWYYVNDEFHFENGHMLLRGSNGSGKSVTMQSFIPLLLDGNKSSERLDSFGTRSRRLENYLLEEDSDRDDRIGYLYLEFKREDSEIYKTIGMGLHARRNKPLDSWYFVIEDNRRIGKDIFLMEDDLAITKQVLKSRIGSQLIETQKEYMERVNKALFNFSSIDEYRECINLLMQLRSPKLSNSLRPTMINEILSNSLQPLSEEDLRPMSEAISNMDEIQDQLDALKVSFTAAKQIANVYEQYNYASLEKKATAYLSQEQATKVAHKEIKELTLKREKEKKQLLEASERRDEKKQETELLKDELSNLLSKDLLQVVEEIERYKKEQKNDEESFASKKQQEQEKENQYLDSAQNVKKYNEEKELKQYEIDKVFKELTKCNEQLQFEEHGAIEQELMGHLDKEYDFTYTLSKIKNEIHELDNGLTLFNELHKEKSVCDKYKEDKEKAIAEIENKNAERNALEQQFCDLQEQIQEQFSIWNKNNQFLVFNNEEMQYIYDQLRQYMENDSYSTISNFINEHYQETVLKLGKKENEQVHMHKLKRDEIIEKRKELRYWEEQTEPTPFQNEYVEASRQYIKQAGIDVRPLYEVLDFSEEVTEEMRNIFEEQLDCMGILDAILVNEENRKFIMSLPKGMADQFICIDKDVKNLDVYYLSVQEDGSLDFKEMLESIGVKTNEIHLWDATYQNGIVSGVVSRVVPSRFIGKQAREAYRLEKINEIKTEIAILEDEANAIQVLIDSIRKNIEILDEEVKSYPKKDLLLEIKNQILKFDQWLILRNENLQSINESIRECMEKMNIISLKISEIALHLGINSSFDVFSIRKETMVEYSKCLDELKSCHREFLSKNELYCNELNRKNELQNDLDSLRYDISNLEKHLMNLSQLIAQKEKKLSDEGYDNVKKRIDEIQNRLRVLPDEIEELIRLIVGLEKNISTAEAEVEKKQNELETKIAEKEQAYQKYLEEVQLGYVLSDPSVYKDASYTCQFIKNRKTTNKNVENLGNDLQTVFYNQRGALQEYGLSIYTLFENQEGNSRLDIVARYRGERISFTQLLENLENNIESQKALLEENDRHLIEDILINTISRKIRNCISSSRRWVDTMNRYMNAMNTSSGLKLSLQWKSHKAENEEELNSEQLVALLEKDPKILKESDFKSLSSHFRSKIQSARKIAEQTETLESFHQIMKNVMDYRNWFDFKILYEKTGEKKKELTNTAFYAFSGGEKAMSMYVPLFSAVAAKFEGASEDAPNLIALDEAFAGVDEKNINNMFALISKFGFDYIMNSQVLWGDYPSVKSLAIHELFRPENAHYVTVISYIWNGNEKVMVI